MIWPSLPATLVEQARRPFSVVASRLLLLHLQSVSPQVVASASAASWTKISYRLIRFAVACTCPTPSLVSLATSTRSSSLSVILAHLLAEQDLMAVRQVLPFAITEPRRYLPL